MTVIDACSGGSSTKTYVKVGGGGQQVYQRIRDNQNIRFDGSTSEMSSWRCNKVLRTNRKHFIVTELENLRTAGTNALIDRTIV